MAGEAGQVGHVITLLGEDETVDILHFQNGCQTAQIIHKSAHTEVTKICTY